MQCQKLKTYMETGRVLFLPPRSIRPNPSQPRRIFQDEALAELADSIRDLTATFARCAPKAAAKKEAAADKK